MWRCMRGSMWRRRQLIWLLLQLGLRINAQVPCSTTRVSMCCGDGVCDGPETSGNCAADCNGEEQEQEPEDGGSRCGGEVVTLEVDGVSRCYSVGYAPSTPAARVLVAFHGSGGSALACGRDTSDTGMVGASQAVGDLVSVCVAAVAGQWDTAAMEVTTAGGNTCGGTDLPYVAAVIRSLQDSGRLDLSLPGSGVFTFGHSQGAMMSAQTAVCGATGAVANLPAVTAFAQSASGLKLKGDGISIPFGSGELETSEWFPVVPVPLPQLKLCSFGAMDDPSPAPDNDFYRSGLAMEQQWGALGNPVQALWVPTGGHSQTCTFQQVLDCLLPASIDAPSPFPPPDLSSPPSDTASPPPDLSSPPSDTASPPPSAASSTPPSSDIASPPPLAASSTPPPSVATTPSSSSAVHCGACAALAIAFTIGVCVV